MKIDGRAIAQAILAKLTPDVDRLKQKSITPHLVVILIGNNANSLAYIRQKKKQTEQVGAKFTLLQYETMPDAKELINKIKEFNADPNVHGLILQRPLPQGNDPQPFIKYIDTLKEVDGFGKNSIYVPPVASAVFKILSAIYRNQVQPDNDFSNEFIKWLGSKNVALLGRGETAGKPIADLFKKHKLPFTLLHSKSENRVQVLKAADIIVSSVGKAKIINANQVQPGAILVGVGLEYVYGKLVGDYDDDEMERVDAIYTPTPGGVGPVNVACLVENVVNACQKLTVANR